MALQLQLLRPRTAMLKTNRGVLLASSRLSTPLQAVQLYMLVRQQGVFLKLLTERKLLKFSRRQTPL